MGVVIVIILASAAMLWVLDLKEYRDERKAMEETLPLYKIENGCILSKQGDITVVFELSQPEIFTLSPAEYDNMWQAWVKAVKILPQNSVLHKQDYYFREAYAPKKTENRSFLRRQGDLHFKGRVHLEHSCYLMLTKKATGRKPASSAMNNLLRGSLIPVKHSDKQYHAFMDTASQFQRILEDSKIFRVKRLTEEHITGTEEKTGLLGKYLYLQKTGEAPLIKDTCFKPEWKIGDNYMQLFSLSEPESLPATVGSYARYEKFSTDKTVFPVGFSAPLGLLLNCNHIYNQYIVVGEARQTLKKLESKRLRLQSLSGYSRENAISRDATSDFLNEAIAESRLPVKAHFNVMLWTDNALETADLRNSAASAIVQMNGQPRQETLGAPQLYLAGLPGNGADLPGNECFDTFAEQAACFLAMETNYGSVSPEAGIRFCDRLSGRPVFADFYDSVREKGITQNMGTLVCGTSGGGKSMTVNHILHTLFEQGAHCLTVDIGGSYKGLCELVGGYYFTYEEHNPIRFNPFYLQAGEVLDTEKKESLKSLLISLWKQENENFNRSEYVALSNALQGYYLHLEQNKDLFPCFNTFYEYLQSHYTKTLKGFNVKDADFDVNNFLYVLMPYYKGGEFDYLLNATEKLDMLNQPFVVFELDNVKDHPILFPVVTLVIMELFISKMRKLKGKRKVLTIDEAWKAIAKAGMAEFIKYAFKTIRKFNGIPIVITQELDDLISSPIIKDAIINNADVKILMDMRKYLHKFDRLQEALGLSEKGKTILLSVNKDDREIFVDLAGQEMKVYRNELCPEEYYAYTTEGKERVKVMEYAARYGSMEKGLAQLTNEQKMKEKEGVSNDK